MTALSPLRYRTKGENGGEELESFFMGGNEFPDYSNGNLLEIIDFDDLFVGINDGGDMLPDLEMDSEVFSEFSSSGGEELEAENVDISKKKDKDDVQPEEIVSKREEPPTKVENKGRKSPAKSKNSQGKRKVKVDWTPELHRRFVEAVEQLGVDKAVPSRILEIMGIHCLTRHNIASHLQKYRSHRKHLLAREAEAASWSQPRKIYGGSAGGGGSKISMSPWIAPTMGFPQNPMSPLQHFRPLHVWGHPSADQSFVHMWPKHLVPATPPAAVWAPTLYPSSARTLPNNSFWHSPQHRVPQLLNPATTRIPSAALVPGIPSPRAMYRVDTVPTTQSGPHPPFIAFHPTKESIDSAIGDILSKPWQPLPIGLKPPSIDSVMVELQRQGVSQIPLLVNESPKHHPAIKS